MAGEGDGEEEVEEACGDGRGAEGGGRVEVKDWFKSYSHAKRHLEQQEEIVTSRLEAHFKPGAVRIGSAMNNY
eukprot:764948-Hanusia_phi.AAC.5